MAVQCLVEQQALPAMLSLLRFCEPEAHSNDTAGELAGACLAALTQMCMDDECAAALRTAPLPSGGAQGSGLAIIGALLLGGRWTAATAVASSCSQGELPLAAGGGGGEADATLLPTPLAVQCAAARLLRFIFALERNRRPFKQALAPDLLAQFVDVGSYVWPLQAYLPFVRLVNGLSSHEAALLRRGLGAFADGVAPTAFGGDLRAKRGGDEHSVHQAGCGCGGNAATGLGQPFGAAPAPAAGREGLIPLARGGANAAIGAAGARGGANAAGAVGAVAGPPAVGGSYGGREPQLVGGFELLECVGAGAFGRVFLARYAGERGEYALKEVPIETRPESAAWAHSRPESPAATAAPLPTGARRPSRSSTPRGQRREAHASGNAPSDAGAGRADLDDCGQAREEGGMARGGLAFPSAPEAGDDPAAEISREVQLLRQLDHPNVVRYYSSFTTGSGENRRLWIVMEFCGGVSLQGLAESAREKGLTRLPEEQTWRIFVQLCLAIRYLHMDKGIVHRDLTPNNVLVQVHTLAVKVADFGLARQKLGANAASLMKTMVGTILYSCPEIVQQQPYTNKTDVWALGCILYKLATLRDPFQGGNPLAVARKIVECDYERLDPARHSRMLVTTIGRCLTVEPEARPDIEEVVRLITPALVRQLENSERAAASGHREQRHLRATAAAGAGAGACGFPASGVGRACGAAPASAVASGGQAAQLLLPPAPPPALARPLPPPTQQLTPRDMLGGRGLPSHAAAVGSGGDYHLTAAAGGVEKSDSLESDPSVGKVHVPRHLLRNVADPLSRALAVVHKLVFAGSPALMASQASRRMDGVPPEVHFKRGIVDRYFRWLFGDRRNAPAMRHEITRLMQRSQEPVLSGLTALTPAAREAAPTYDCLQGYIDDICAAHGYDTVSPTRPGSAEEGYG
eukprot:TRINITY_DN23345_c0_g1_i1.p1 TRINITY_DN23345_c0_g1~~TRINITY_DN23345_c0_g1_i1.p1  ORF type:complete len:1056 (+),score=200.20 TRINITY_DN23345_c0_g1_i1:415-3168(+)